MLSFAIALAVFFVLWATLHDGREDLPLMVAGISASIVLVAAVFLREYVLRRARLRYLRFERQLDYNLNNLVSAPNVDSSEFKLSLKRNAYLVDQLSKKSDAAKVLGHLPDGHWDVFELCDEYLSLNDVQLQTVGVGSPRLAALRRGKEIVQKLHKFHLLKWVEIETRSLTEEASRLEELSEKVQLTKEALAAIDSALEFYPDEATLLESKLVLEEFISSVRISHWIGQAEREALKKNYIESISLYRDSLFYLAREKVDSDEKTLIAKKINDEIERIRALIAKKPKKTAISKNAISKKTKISKEYKDD